MKLLTCLLTWFVALAVTPLARANVYNVTGTADGTGTITSLGGGNFNASTLRAAVNDANAAAGVNTINVPAGTYTLSLGELPIGTTSNTTVNIIGATPASTFIFHDTNSAAARVLDLDPNLFGGVTVNIQNVTIGHGRNTDGNGGAGIIAGYQGPPVDSTALSNCVLLDNQVLGAASDAVGGGIQNIGGNLSVIACAFIQNSATNFSGGGIFYDSHTPSIGICQIVSCQFSNNIAGDSSDGGGAIFVSGVAGSALSVSNSIFVSNRVTSVGGNGGAIIKFGTAPLTVTACTFLNNQVLGSSTPANSASGGAIDNAGGPLTVQYCRFFGNTAAQPTHGNAVNNASAAGATLSASNNWWGVNTGAGYTDLVGATAPVWLKLVNTANPSTVAVGNSTILTASVLTNSAGTAIPISNLGVLIGLPIVFTNATNGTLSGQQTSIQPSGTATATFTATSPSLGTAQAKVDNAIATAQVTIPCLPFTATLSGGGAICPGNSVNLTVTFSGGFPPYSVQISNVLGIASGPGPVLIVPVSPSTATTYSLISATDNGGCPGTLSGSASVTISTISPPVITPTPATVVNLSSGNQASGPAGYAGYGWTISNGTIIGPANAATVTYSAGLYGSVTLGLTVTNASGCFASDSIIVPIVVQPVTSFGCDLRTNYFSSLTFTDALPEHPAGIAFDGTNYWAVSAGISPYHIGRYDLNGVLLTNYTLSFDPRSVFVGPNSAVYVRAYNTNIIYRQTSPGVLVPGVVLTGGTLDPQAQVILNGAGTEYDALSSGGLVSRWDLTGSYLGSVTLQGFTTSENTYPWNRALGAAGEFWVTFATNGISVWDTTGTRLGRATLAGATSAFDGGFSFSYCNGKAFVSDGPGALWHAFDVCDEARVAIYGAPSTPSWNFDVQTKIISAGSIPQVDAFWVTNGAPVPALADFQRYEAVFVYSDSSFNDPTAIGNALAAYIDIGGGVAVATFAYDSSVGLGFGGRLSTNNYLPFTAGSQNQGTDMTLAPDVPSHPLLDGLTSFDGGSASYHNYPITNTAGAIIVAHWSVDSEPLVGGKDDPPGRTAGLNFYPPSSDVRPDFWVSSTDGARLMANALLWSGKIPPTISLPPTNQTAATGTHISLHTTAAGTPPLAYQWLLNGTNIAGATSNSLAVTVQTNTVGVYRVLVANPYGVSISPGASLNPPIRFLQPVPSGNSLPLYLANSDGSPITSAEASTIELFTTTDPSQPFSNWTLATYPMVLTNGLLRVNGVTLANSHMFFRARQVP